jgi:ubiquinone biosynthesis protein UbiJ
LFLAPILKPVETFINRGIGQSAAAAQLCAELDGRSMSVIIDMQPLRIPLSLKITANDGRIYVGTDPESGADVEISGTLIELNRVIFLESEAPLRQGHVRTHGDTEIAEQFRMLLLLARPNLEEDLADLVGDEAAPRIAGAFRNIRHFAFDTLEDIAERVSDYLKEDGQHLPERTETETFFSDVDELSNDLARTEARLSRLGKQLEKNDRTGD